MKRLDSWTSNRGLVHVLGRWIGLKLEIELLCGRHSYVSQRSVSAIAYSCKECEQEAGIASLTGCQQESRNSRGYCFYTKSCPSKVECFLLSVLAC